MADNQWFIMIGQERQGPMSTDDVRFLLSRKNIDGGTLIWSEVLGTWSRLREVEEFRPNPKDEAEAEAEQPEETVPEKTPPPPDEATSKKRMILKVLPALLTLGLVGGAVFVFITDDTPKRAKQKTTSSTRNQRGPRTPQDLVEQLKGGDPAAKRQLIQAGSRSVPALIQALMEKGSPIRPQDVRAILIEIGPSSAFAIGDALEGIDLSKAALIILVEVLGEFGGLTSVPALIVALGNPDPDVQAEAIEAIGKLDPAVGPALARHLTQPVEQLSKRQKKNLAEALGKHGSPESIPIMQQAQRSEQDAETIAALATAIEQISRSPRTDPSAQTPLAQTSSQRASNRDTRQTENVSIHVSATATATATATVESTEDAKEAPTGEDADTKAQRAKDLAEEGRKLREEGRDDEALEKYRQAYALHSIRVYLLIIFELEGDPLTARASDDTSSAPDLPEIEAPRKVLLSEIYSELDRPKPDLGPYGGSFGLWSGRTDEGDPISRDGAQDLYIVRGESGQDFIAAVGRNEMTANDLGANRTWRGTLQGFRIIEDGEETRMLPVLLVDKIE